MNILTFGKKGVMIFLYFVVSVCFAQDLTQKVENQIQSILKTQEDYPSGVIAITKKDSILLLKGFGLSDIENNLEFDARKSLLNTASISKMITATGILQLIEKGKIKLDNPVNKYLNEINLKNPFKNQVTIRQLLIHTSGMSDMSIGLGSKSKEEIREIKDYLKEHLPPIVWKPSEYYNYSNFAFVLLARVIENVSELSYQDYVQQYIFDPLQMKNSRIGDDYDNPLQMKPYKWKWYNDDSGIYLDPKGLTYSNLIGASAFMTTGEDISHFMQAYLNYGKWNNNRILDSITVADAWSEKFGYDKKIPHKMGLGWHIKIQNDVKQVYHYGDGSGIETALLFLPEKDISIFMSFNNDAENVKYQIMDSLTKHFYPHFLDKRVDFVISDDIQDKSGVFRYMNLSQHTFEKIVYFFGVKTLKVDDVDGEIYIDGSVYRPIDTNIYEHEKQFGWLKFIIEENNKVSHLTFGYSTYKKLKWWEYPIVHQVVIALGVLFFIIISLVIFIYSLRTRKKPLKSLIFILINGLLIPIAFISMMLAKDDLSIDFGVSPFYFFYIVFSLPLIALILYPFSIYSLVKIKKQALSHSTKIIAMLAIALLTSQLLISWYYNIIGYNFG